MVFLAVAETSQLQRGLVLIVWILQVLIGFSQSLEETDVGNTDGVDEEDHEEIDVSSEGEPSEHADSSVAQDGESDHLALAHDQSGDEEGESPDVITSFQDDPTISPDQPLEDEHSMEGEPSMEGEQATGSDSEMATPPNTEDKEQSSSSTGEAKGVRPKSIFEELEELQRKLSIAKKQLTAKTFGFV